MTVYRYRSKTVIVPVPTQGETSYDTTTDPTVLGYEACNTCSWKHVFWEADGEPKPQLIAGLGFGDLYICPSCGATGRRTQVGPVPASTFLSAEEIKEHLARGMTKRQHLRAAIRWCLPWDEDSRTLLCSTVGLWLLASLLAIPWTGLGVLRACAELAWRIGLAAALWRTCVLGLLTIIDLVDHHRRLVGMRILWWECGRSRLAPNLQERIANWRWRRQWRKKHSKK